MCCPRISDMLILIQRVGNVNLNGFKIVYICSSWFILVEIDSPVQYNLLICYLSLRGMVSNFYFNTQNFRTNWQLHTKVIFWVKNIPSKQVICSSITAVSSPGLSYSWAQVIKFRPPWRLLSLVLIWFQRQYICQASGTHHGPALSS